MTPIFSIQKANTAKAYEKAKALFLEYAQSMEFNFCFETLDAELAQLSNIYRKPHGGILLLWEGENAVGCVAWMAIGASVIELRRMYIQPTYRGYGQGRQLLQQALIEMKRGTFKRIRLETIEGRMDSAIRLYEQVGFKKMPSTCGASNSCSLKMELEW